MDHGCAPSGEHVSRSSLRAYNSDQERDAPTAFYRTHSSTSNLVDCCGAGIDPCGSGLRLAYTGYDGPSDTIPSTSLPDKLKNATAATTILRPIYDATDAIEELSKSTNLDRQTSWQPSRLDPAFLEQQLATSPILEKAKALYDAADAVENMATQSASTANQYWHPQRLDPSTKMTAFVKTAATQAGKALYDARDAIEEMTKSAASDSASRQPRQSRPEAQAANEEGLPNQQMPQGSPSQSPEGPQQSTIQDSSSTVPHPPEAHAQAPRDLSSSDPLHAPIDHGNPVLPDKLPSALKGTRQAALNQDAGSSQDASQRRIDQTYRNMQQRRGTVVSGDNDDELYEVAHGGQLRCHDHYPEARCRCCRHKTAGHHGSQAIANTHSRSVRNEIDETSNSLQLATQTLDRALIGLNQLLDEATSLARQASRLGRRADEERWASSRSMHYRHHSRHRSSSRRVPTRRRSYDSYTDSSSSSIVERPRRRRVVSFDNTDAPMVQSLTSVTYPKECVFPTRSSQLLSPESLFTGPDIKPSTRDEATRGPDTERAVDVTNDDLSQTSDAANLYQISIDTFDELSAARQQARLRAVHPLLRRQESWHSDHSPHAAHHLPGTVRADMWPPQTSPLQVTGTRMVAHSDSTGYILEGADLKHPRRSHLSLPGDHGVPPSFQRKQKPTAREWTDTRKRVTATIACCNTVFVGLLAGIYAGEVPRIQYQIADLDHRVILGNVMLYIGIAITTLFCWPLPLLHGRKPYTVTAFALMLPLQYPQALAVATFQDPDSVLARVGLLLPRLITGMAMGFANINFLPTLFDLFGASLMSDNPHQEHVQLDDVRRQGGGIGIWLGIWSWCYTASLSVGFCLGAVIIQDLEAVWGFYLTIILLAVFLMLNIMAPETRLAPHRRTVIHIFDATFTWRRRVAKGEVHLHLWQTGPKWWADEVWAGIILTCKMILQLGFFVTICYFAWLFAQIVLMVVLLGALLSRWYEWRSDYVGAASLALAIGALLAVPLTHANWFSRSRITPPRSNSVTLHNKSGIHLTSHMLRRCVFTLVLPLAGLAYTLASPGPEVSWVVPVVFVGLIGFLSNLATSECVGLIMETFDTCDLQAGTNSRHREKSLPDTVKKARTHFSSYPRVCAGFFAAQSMGFLLAAVVTGVSGAVTRAIGAQISAASVAGILLVLTLLLLAVLLRFRSLQVIPSGILDASEIKSSWASPTAQEADWRPVILGNPSGKLRRINLLELGKMSRWMEIRRLNGLE